MHPYHTRASIASADIPPSFLLDALDDDRDGEEDAGLYDQLAENASAEVDGYLGGRYTVPFTGTVPPLVIVASRIFCLEGLYARRGYTRKSDPPNPWAGRADDIRARLSRIAAGEEPLVVDTSGPSIDVVTEPSRTHSARGKMGY
jgi:phage gp36-like protein